MPGELPLNKEDLHLIKMLKSVRTLRHLNDNEIKEVIGSSKRYKYENGETIFSEGEIGTAVYIVLDGIFVIEKYGQVLKVLNKGDLFGEIALIDERPRTGTVKAKSNGMLLVLDKEQIQTGETMSASALMKIYRGFSELITSYIREGDTLYDEMDVLIIQDGGCAPGYNPVTGYIAEFLEKMGRQIFVAAQGFKSVVQNKSADYRCLIYDYNRYRQMDHIRGVLFAPPLRAARGADFRTERYPQFKEEKNQELAIRAIKERKVKIVIGVGGNGTFAGIYEMSKKLPDVSFYFIPVTIDSDIWGTSCIGEFTGVEVGAEKIRGYMADARTHGRCYIVEMMGAHGGYHALHSCLGAGAHLAVLPSSNYNIDKLAKVINPRSETVIVVAEGYKIKLRREEGYLGNAAEYFRDELIKAGLDTQQKVICEAFSRDIRGAMPNNMDITLAQRMARKICDLITDGIKNVMPAVRAGQEYNIPFDDIRTDNSVESTLANLANRLF
ncbi:MAG: 6-phosphofructokinase [Calditrichae bacterium]|nr:6-phosphofructokinase [Calditrichota bacterium]MCB9058959.1 6-phosphofructokinase [Calditrichia bacterium]